MATKKRSERMQLVIDLAKRKEEAALSALRESRKALELEQHRLFELNRYYAEYQSSSSGEGRAFEPEDFLRKRQFLAKLDTALDQQKQQIFVVEQRLEADTKSWKILSLKTESLISYQQRCRDDERRAEDKREQKLLDELSARRYSSP
jgi:flagellar FliJ protein